MFEKIKYGFGWLKNQLIEKIFGSIAAIGLIVILVCLVVSIVSFTGKLKRSDKGGICDSTKYFILSIVLAIVLFFIAIFSLGPKLVWWFNTFKRYLMKRKYNREKYGNKNNIVLNTFENLLI